MTTQSDVFAAIMAERAYQDDKWGTPKQNPHGVIEWLLIAEEELNEAKAAWMREIGDRSALGEMLQAAAVLVACLEQHGIVERRVE